MMHQRLILIVIAFAMFMESLDSTALNTALPAMAQNLSVNPVDLKLALISYLLSLAVFIPISGWVADKYGTKRIFILAITIFTLSSIACAQTHSLIALVCTRALQGLGGSMMLPVARLIIIKTSARHEIISKMTVVIMIASFGIFLGPLIGGLITHYLSWRWIFWVNAPVGLFVILLATKVLPELPRHRVHRLDKIGFTLFSSGLVLLTLGLSLISESTVELYPAFLMLAIACLLLFSYVIWSKHQRHPIVNTKLFKIRTFSVAVIGNLFCRISFGGAPFLLPLTFQIGLGFEPQFSGLLLAPIAMGVFVIKPLSLHILRRLGYKKVLLINTFCIAGSIGLFATISKSSSSFTIALLTFSYGVFIALQFTAMNSLAYAETTHDHQSSATSIMSTIQQLGMSFGVAIAAMCIRFFEYLNLHPNLLTLSVLHRTFIFASIITALSGLIFMKLTTEDGQQLINRPHAET